LGNINLLTDYLDIWEKSFWVIGNNFFRSKKLIFVCEMIFNSSEHLLF